MATAEYTRMGIQGHSHSDRSVRRRQFIALIGGFAMAGPLACYAQQARSAPPKRVGVLSQLGCPTAPESLLIRRLADHGWVDGRNLVFDCVSTIDRLDQVPTLARELVSRRPDVLIAGPHTFIAALKHETTTIPIVMLGGWDPVRLGFVTSLARPEGNVTGVAWFNLLSKQMELLKEIVPHLKRVAFIDGGPSPGPEVIKIGTEDAAIAASKLGLTGQLFQPAVASDYEETFARIAAEHFDAAYIPSTPFNSQNQTRICKLALRHLIPAISEYAGWPRGGLLLSYGQDDSWSVTRALEYVDKILRGAKPSDLPVEQATKLLLTINLKTARALGLAVPPSLLALADEVIE
jgi:putative ABC transport system substrate-binding protein